MQPNILPAEPADLPAIITLFEEAIQYQKNNGYTGWSSYDVSFIKMDIEQGLLFKISGGEEIVCIFSICFRDEHIWRERDQGDALYLHRIILNGRFRGVKIFRFVLNWAIEKAIKAGKHFVRMDTWAENEKLIDYYKNYGFRFIENYTTTNTEGLPLQNRNLKVALLEYTIT